MSYKTTYTSSEQAIIQRMPNISLLEQEWLVLYTVLHRFLRESDAVVWAFGSRVKWMAEQRADIDLCVHGMARSDDLALINS